MSADKCYRLWRLARLQVPHKRRRRRRGLATSGLQPATRPRQTWAMDFVHDSLWNGRKLRTLNVIDVFAKESSHIEIDTSINGKRVCRILDPIVEKRGMPRLITIDNGPEFAGKALDRWSYQNQIMFDFIRPGKPVDNCYIESYNSRFREECLNTHYFDSLSEARVIVEDWRKVYNEFRPHTTLKGLTPAEFAKQHQPISTANTNLAVVQ